jgi:hypothetical protein
MDADDGQERGNESGFPREFWSQHTFVKVIGQN